MPVVRSQMLSLNLTIEQIVQIIQIKWNTTECEIELRRSKKTLLSTSVEQLIKQFASENRKNLFSSWNILQKQFNIT